MDKNAIVDLAATTLADLTATIRDAERELAPGSESGLWGEYCEDMRLETGVLPYHDETDAVGVPPEVASWWLGRYCAEIAAAASGADPTDCEGHSLLPDDLLLGDIEWIGSALHIVDWDAARRGYMAGIAETRVFVEDAGGDN